MSVQTFIGHKSLVNDVITHVEAFRREVRQCVNLARMVILMVTVNPLWFESNFTLIGNLKYSYYTYFVFVI